jgi:predicted porin
MKNLLIILLLLAPLSLSGQYRHILSVNYAPQDNGIGFKYDYRIDKIGLYGTYSYGNYYGEDENFEKWYITNHNRYSAGVTFWNTEAHLMAGLVYHSNGKVKLPESIAEPVKWPVSLEFGIAGSVNRFNAGFRYDILRKEGMFEFGVALFRKRCYTGYPH